MSRAALFINMEHSNLTEDLTVTYICPNGQSVQVQDQSGGNYDSLVNRWTATMVPIYQGWDLTMQDSWADNGTWTENAVPVQQPIGNLRKF